MIDPTDVTKFDRTEAELEEWWLFSTVVAGKTAATQAKLLDHFLRVAAPTNNTAPFSIIRSLINDEADWAVRYAGTPYGDRPPLEHYLRASHMGQYRRLVRCWRESLSLDLRNDPVEAFEAIHGVGPKTARMFIMHSRPDQRLAAIDTHILKFLRSHGDTEATVTPSSQRKYRQLENKFLAHADASGLSPADFDLMIWKSYARR